MLAIIFSSTRFHVESGSNFVIRRAMACGFGTEILLVHDAVVIHQERHDARRVITRGIGDEAKTADHGPAHDIVIGAARRIGALSLQNAIVIAVVGRRLAALGFLVALGSRSYEQRSEGTRLFAGFHGPVKAVALVRGAPKSLGILKKLGLLRVAQVVLALPVRERKRCLHRMELVAADAAVEQFLFALRDVETPRLPLP